MEIMFEHPIQEGPYTYHILRHQFCQWGVPWSFTHPRGAVTKLGLTQHHYIASTFYTHVHVQSGILLSARKESQRTLLFLKSALIKQSCSTATAVAAIWSTSTSTWYGTAATVQLSPGELFHQRQGGLIVPSTSQTREASMDTGAPVRLGGFWLGVSSVDTKWQDGKQLWRLTTATKKQKTVGTQIAITNCWFCFVVKRRSQGQLKLYFCRCSNFGSCLEPSLWPCRGLASNEQEGQGAPALTMISPIPGAQPWQTMKALNKTKCFHGLPSTSAPPTCVVVLFGTVRCFSWQKLWNSSWTGTGTAYRQ